MTKKFYLELPPIAVLPFCRSACLVDSQINTTNLLLRFNATLLQLSLPVQSQNAMLIRKWSELNLTLKDLNGNIIPGSSDISQPILDGNADPNECIYLWWAAVSRDALPVYSIRPFIDDNYLTKEVDVIISDSNTDMNAFNINSMLKTCHFWIDHSTR